MSGIILRQGTADAYRPVVTIASGQSVSSAARMSKIGTRMIALRLPDAWTAANIALEVSDEWGTNTPTVWSPLQKADGTRVMLENIPTSSDPRPERPFPFEAWMAGAHVWVRVVSISTSNGAAVNQAAARELVLVFGS